MIAFTHKTTTFNHLLRRNAGHEGGRVPPGSAARECTCEAAAWRPNQMLAHAGPVKNDSIGNIVFWGDAKTKKQAGIQITPYRTVI